MPFFGALPFINATRRAAWQSPAILETAQKRIIIRVLCEHCALRKSSDNRTARVHADSHFPMRGLLKRVRRENRWCMVTPAKQV